MSVDHGPRIGADPEIFIQDEQKKILPICGLIGGTKDNPIVITDMVKAQWGYSPTYRPVSGRAIALGEVVREDKGDFAVQEDNVMLEFNIPASQTVPGFVDNLSKAMDTIQIRFLQPRGVDYRFNKVTNKFSRRLLSAAGRQAFEIGCEPDYDAYSDPNLGFKRDPFCAMDLGSSRFCGGHLHVQYNKNNCEPHIFAQLMDCIVGVPSILHDVQGRRRKFYGLPGLYREKPYGIEYRTLSNFWLAPHIRARWLEGALDGIFWLANKVNTSPNDLKETYSLVDWDRVREVITTENVSGARSLLEDLSNCGFYISNTCVE